MGRSKRDSRDSRRDALITSSLWIVEVTVNTICNGSTRPVIKSDATGDATLALVEAARKFEGPTTKFTGYATSRVRGAVLDRLSKEASYTGAFVLGLDLERIPDATPDRPPALDLSVVTASERYVIERYVQGYTLAEIDRDLGKYRGWSRRIKQAALSKLSKT